MAVELKLNKLLIIQANEGISYEIYDCLVLT